MATTIHILVIEHEHGIDVSAHRSNETAYAALANYCREFWQEARDQIPELSEDPSGVDKIVVTCYFNALEDTAKAEHWEIRAVELEDKAPLVEETCDERLDLLEKLLGATEPYKDEMTPTARHIWQEIAARTADLREGTE